MIRSIFHICISLVLLVSTVGFSVSKHYCGGHLVDVSLNIAAQTACSTDKNACETGGCCRNESQTFQVRENVTPVVVINHLPVLSFEIPAFLASVDCLTEPETQDNDLNQEVHSPPPRELSVYLAEIQTYLL
ncbi:MAG: hypothetical protein AB2L24_12365 [Mangrovibacterium sp.]